MEMGKNTSALYPKVQYHDAFRIVEFHYPPYDFQAFHKDVKYKLSIVLSGKLKECTHKSEEWASSASVVFKSPDVRHQNQFGPGGARMVSIVPNPSFLQELETVVQLPDWQWGHLPMYTQSAIQFINAYKYETNQDDLKEEVIELFSCLLKFKPKNYQDPPEWLARIAEQLREEFDTGLKVQDLAKNVGVHSVYLARIFRKFYGYSIKEYQCQLRLQSALDALSSSRTPLVHVALNQGFTDQAHFCRVFKNHLKMSPGTFRALVRQS